jgi:hypothetical protein
LDKLFCSLSRFLDLDWTNQPNDTFISCSYTEFQEICSGNGSRVSGSCGVGRTSGSNNDDNEGELETLISKRWSPIEKGVVDTRVGYPYAEGGGVFGEDVDDGMGDDIFGRVRTRSLGLGDGVSQGKDEFRVVLGILKRFR